MKNKKLREMSSQELEKELSELKSELFKLRFSLATNGLENPLKVKDVRKDIARVKTILRERELKINITSEKKEKAIETESKKEEKSKKKEEKKTEKVEKTEKEDKKKEKVEKKTEKVETKKPKVTNKK